MSLKYKVGDRVRVCSASGFSSGAKGVVTTKDHNERVAFFGDTFPENIVWVLRDGASSACYFYEGELEHLEEAEPNTTESKETASFSMILTSIGVVNNKAYSLGAQQENVVSDAVFNALYSPNSTQIKLDSEDGHVYLILEQDYDGAIQQIRLDIDEVDAVFSAIKKLTNQLGE